MTEAPALDVYTDFVCPWCYLGTGRVARLQREYAIDVRWVYFPLHPETPAEGLALTDLFAGRHVDLDAVHARLNALLEAEGLPYGPRTHTYNSRLAQELAKWADSQTGPAFAALPAALYRAYFVEARNLGDLDALLDVAASVGVPVDTAREVLTTRVCRAAVDADWVKARRAGVTGVPTFVCGEHQVVGAQPYDVLERLMAAAGVPRRS